jgi:hypothetical protein
VRHSDRLVVPHVRGHLLGSAAEGNAVSGGGLGAGGHHVQRSPEGEGDALGIAPRLARPLPHTLGLFPVLLGMERDRRAQADGMPGVAELAGAPDGGLGVTSDPDGDTASLARLRQGAHGCQVIISAPEVDRLPCPALAHQAQVLVGDPAALLVGRGVKSLEFFTHPAHTGAEDHTPAGEHVEGGQHLGRHHRVAVGHHQHARAEPHVPGCAREPCQHGQWLEVALGPVRGDLARGGVGIRRVGGGRDHHVVSDEHRRETKGVSTLGDSEHDVGRGERAAAG